MCGRLVQPHAQAKIGHLPCASICHYPLVITTSNKGGACRYGWVHPAGERSAQLCWRGEGGGRTVYPPGRCASQELGTVCCGLTQWVGAKLQQQLQQQGYCTHLGRDASPTARVPAPCALEHDVAGLEVAMEHIRQVQVEQGLRGECVWVWDGGGG